MMSTAKNRLSTASQSSLRSLSGGSPWSPPEKHYDDDYNDEVLNRAGSTLAVPYFGPKNGVHLTYLIYLLTATVLVPIYGATRNPTALLACIPGHRERRFRGR